MLRKEVGSGTKAMETTGGSTKGFAASNWKPWIVMQKLPDFRDIISKLDELSVWRKLKQSNIKWSLKTFLAQYLLFQ